MNSARPIKDEASAPGTGAAIVSSPGALLARTDTVRAEVLCRLLARETLTGLETVFGAGTTRLAAVVHALAEDYGWTIERTDKVVGCNDGRVQTVTTYYLLPSIIAAAMRHGAEAWCSEVRAARALRRAEAADARRKAAQANAARGEPGKRASAAVQADLFQPCGGVAP